YDPRSFQLFTEAFFDSHPCCLVSVTYGRTHCFHGTPPKSLFGSKARLTKVGSRNFSVQSYVLNTDFLREHETSHKNHPPCCLPGSRGLLCFDLFPLLSRIQRSHWFCHANRVEDLFDLLFAKQLLFPSDLDYRASARHSFFRNFSCFGIPDVRIQRRRQRDCCLHVEIAPLLV